jgi:three-Cys-motif partner protein
MTESPLSLRASDGHLARTNGLYARQKLAFLQRYLPVALQATAKKNSRHFIDVFAGPGRNITRATNIEFDGSPIIAAKARATHGQWPFDTIDAYNVDDWAHQALHARFAANASNGSPTHTAHLGDGLALAAARLQQLERGSYAMMTLDIENPNQLPWSAIDVLRQSAPRSTDAYLLLPVGMALVRMLPYDNDALLPNVTALNAFFGDASWAKAMTSRTSDTRRKKNETVRAVVEAYLLRLRTLWQFATPVCRVTRQVNQNQMLYYMLLATDHPAGERLARWASEARHETPQIPLL